MNQNAPVPPPDIATRVRQYVQLRDKIKELDDAHKASMKPYRDALEQLNGILLQELNNAGGNSVSTDFGTCYRKEKKSASLADGDAFMKYVIANSAWDLIDRKANVTAIAELLDDGKPLPPGVNFTKTFDVGVRRK